MVIMFENFKYTKKNTALILIIISITYILMSTFFFWDHEDYSYYINAWENFLQGILDPTYPIGFTLVFAPVYSINPRLPKLCFSVAFLITAWQLYHLIYTGEEYKGLSDKKKFWVIMYLILSPAFAHHVWSGLFDSLIGLLVFNVYLVSRSKKCHWFLRDLIILALILASVVIKFVGIFLLIPFLFLNGRRNPRKGIPGDDKPSENRQRLIARVLLLGAVLVVGLLLVLFMVENPLSLLVPFENHFLRNYETLFDKSWIPLDEPFIMKVIVDIHSAIGNYLFLFALCVVYFYAYKKNVSNAAWIILPIFTFQAFFPVSNMQYLLWIVFVYTAYRSKDSQDEKLTRKMALLQFVGLFVFIPFLQLFYVYFIIDIFKWEARMNDPLQVKNAIYS